MSCTRVNRPFPRFGGIADDGLINAEGDAEVARAAESAPGDGEDVLAGKARVVTKTGLNITDVMISGAEKALRICLDNGVVRACLKAKSPTCGYGTIYDGKFSGTLKDGNGVFTALLLRHGVEIIEV